MTSVVAVAFSHPTATDTTAHDTRETDYEAERDMRHDPEAEMDAREDAYENGLY